MTRTLFAYLTFLLLAVSLPTVALPPKTRMIHPAQFRAAPLVAKHPTCPVEILEIRNLNPRREFFWHDVEIVVRNRTFERIADLTVGLYLRTADVGTVIPFHLNRWRSPSLPDGAACLAPLPAEKRQVLEPNGTCVLYCSAVRNHNQWLQQTFDCSQKSVFEVWNVEFERVWWDFNGRFLSPAEGSRLVVNEEFTKRMYRVLGVPENWEHSAR